MRKPSLLLFLLVFGSIGCAGKTVPASPHPSETPQTLRDGLLSPSLLAIDAPENYFVAAADADGKFRIVKFRRERSETLFSGLGRPGAMAYDFRMGRLFVSEGGDVRIFRLGMFGLSREKLSGEPPKVIPVPKAVEISSVVYSMMNARAYAADFKERRLWSVHPKKGTVEEILDPVSFDSFGAGGPEHVLPSTDGKRIYMILRKPTNDAAPEESTLAILHLKGRRWEKVASFPGLSFSGLDFYRSRFILADRTTGEIRTVSTRDGKVEILPGGYAGPSVAFGMDLGRAVFLTPHTEGSGGKLIRHAIHVKE